MKAAPALRYVRRIRNAAKREYADAYLRALAFHEPEPARPEGLSVMGAQAVRMNLRELTRDDPHYWLAGERPDVGQSLGGSSGTPLYLSCRKKGGDEWP